MIKSSLLVSVLLAAAVPACHHDHPTATPATAESTSSGMTATAEPGKTGDPSNSYNNNSYNSDATSPGATVPGNPALPEINDPDRTGSPRSPAGSGAPTGNGTDTGRDKGVNGSDPDTTTPTMTKDSGSGSNTGTSNNKAPRSPSGTTGKSRSGSSSGSNRGSSDGSAGSGSDVPH